MATLTEIETYNYAHFGESGDGAGGSNFLAFRTTLPVGSMAPDFTAILLSSAQSVRLSDFWRERDTLIEFGSVT